MVVTKVQYCRMSGHMKLVFMVPRYRVIKLTGNPLGNKQTNNLCLEYIYNINFNFGLIKKQQHQKMISMPDMKLNPHCSKMNIYMQLPFAGLPPV